MVFDSHSILERAKAGDDVAKGELLERFRPYLNVIAQRHLDERLRGRLDFTDVVQTTFLEASRDFGAFRGDSIDSLLAWLRNILRNNVHTAHQQHLGTQKRSARMETKLSIPSENGGSSLGMEHIIPAETSTPSQRVMRNETAAILASHLERIPETQQEAIRLRYVEGLSLKEISDKMGKSEMAVAGLLKRGLRSLREFLGDSRAD
jgi:RNA polymerase sigma-70 factor (ECF subfamily)